MSIRSQTDGSLANKKQKRIKTGLENVGTKETKVDRSAAAGRYPALASLIHHASSWGGIIYREETDLTNVYYTVQLLYTLDGRLR